MQPGWYRDPQDPNQARWWDGNAWTAQVRPLKAPATSSSATTSSPESEVLTRHLALLRAEIRKLQEEIIETSDTVLLQEVGIYRYSHPLDSSAEYEQQLQALNEAIKECIKSGEAVATTKKWAINGSEKEGVKMVADFGKLVLRAYNNEVDNVLRTLRPHSLESAVARLEKLRVTIAKLGVSMKLAVTDAYHDLRVRELKLTADYLAKVAEEKERERENRIRLREEEIARKEMEREREKLEKERAHYESAAKALLAKGDEQAAAQALAHVKEVQKAIEGVIEREANVRAGYVYVISNLGSFGDKVVKIGLTRRLEPMDRVRELGDASVPFRYDVHVLIFSEDAVGLETALHRQFADRRLNLVNAHREFFFATPHEVKEALQRLKGDLVSFVETPEALEWHQSENARRESILAANTVSADQSPPS